MKDEEFVLKAIKAKRSKVQQPTHYRKVVIAGEEVNVPVYAEQGRRPKTQMKTRGAQTHDAKITKHLSESDLERY